MMLDVYKFNAAGLPEMSRFAGQEYFRMPGERTVEMYSSFPEQGTNENTGIMLVLHNWGGTWEFSAPWCKVLSEKFNLICISVNYLQSGWRLGDMTYDFGVLQAGDCLRALYWMREYLKKNNIPFHPRRTFSGGASRGGNVSQMVNKFAPRTFGCIVDLCGMSGLTDDMAFGNGILNAGYSRDPEDPAYRSPAMQEIRDLGNPEHLQLQYQANPENKVVIIHGMDDDYCPCAAKIRVFRNMVQAGFYPDGTFVTPAMVDGIILTGTGHAVGDRPYVIAKYGQPYLSEQGQYAKILQKPDDLELKHIVEYPVTGGTYRIDFSEGPATIRFTGSERL
ncbi:MAG: prolyl oligopeptidase family serine peptidase [Lentisphaeria bacterium]|nr:prolyl oligopeptidase family serine peptidase [Lentisphaeria bacterium]